MIDEKEIEEAYKKYEMSPGRKSFDDMDWYETLNLGFTDGAQWAQSKLLEKANSGFEEYFRDRFGEYYHGSNPSHVNHKETWQAARLSLMAENEKLKKQLEITKEALGVYQNNPLATKGNSHEYGDEFYLVEVNGEFVGIRAYAEEVIAKLEEK